MRSFSIIVPTYNYADYLGFAIESLLHQNYPKIEIIIVNDGSTDQTDEVVHRLQQQHPDQIKCLTQINGGAGSARNAGINLATGDYILFLDADDRLLPDALTEFDTFLNSHPDIDAVFAGHTVIRDGRRSELHHAPVAEPTKKQNFLNVLNKNFPAPTGSYIIKRNVLNKIQFSTKITNYEDGIFLAHLVSCHDIAAFDKPVVAIHRHAGSLRSRMRPDTHDADLVCDILFDASIVPPELLTYREQYKSTHLLRLFRRCVLNKDYKNGKLYYHAAIRARKQNLLQLRYLKKYLVLQIKTLFHTR